jgi:hypothetical protein
MTDAMHGWTAVDERSFEHVSGARISKSAARWMAFKGTQSLRGKDHTTVRLFGSPESAAVACRKEGWC